MDLPDQRTEAERSSRLIAFLALAPGALLLLYVGGQLVRWLWFSQ